MKKTMITSVVSAFAGAALVAMMLAGQSFAQTGTDVCDKSCYYNMGYRAGKMDMVAKLVECDGVKNKHVRKEYKETSELLKSFGELEEGSYPCAE